MNFAVKTILACCVLSICGCSNDMKEKANDALGDPVKIEFFGWKVDDDGNQIETNRVVELSYDLKKTLDNATSISWNCKCPGKDRLIIDGKYYFIFGNCKSQGGCQLVSREDDYYLIKEKLKIVDK